MGWIKDATIVRLCTRRSLEPAVIFLFGLEALLIRVSSAQSAAGLSLSQPLAAIGSSNDLTSLQLSALFRVGPGKYCFVETSSSTFSRTALVVVLRRLSRGL